MAQRYRPRFRWVAPSIVSVALALLVGLVLAHAKPLAARPTALLPTATLAPRLSVASGVPSATVTNLPTSATLPTPTIPPRVAVLGSPTAPATVVRARTAVLPPASPTAVPRLVVGRWQDRQVLITEAFTMRGPWRICWLLPDAQIPFQVMAGDAGQTVWELHSGPTGATAGMFDVARGGAYRLMIHSETPL